MQQDCQLPGDACLGILLRAEAPADIVHDHGAVVLRIPVVRVVEGIRRLIIPKGKNEREDAESGDPESEQAFTLPQSQELHPLIDDGQAPEAEKSKTGLTALHVAQRYEKDTGNIGNDAPAGRAELMTAEDERGGGAPCGGRGDGEGNLRIGDEEHARTQREMSGASPQKG